MTESEAMHSMTGGWNKNKSTASTGKRETKDAA
jgi:hypothetical protein